jgi:hypothetical protein
VAAVPGVAVRSFSPTRQMLRPDGFDELAILYKRSLAAAATGIQPIERERELSCAFH